MGNVMERNPEPVFPVNRARPRIRYSREQRTRALQFVDEGLTYREAGRRCTPTISASTIHRWMKARRRREEMARTINEYAWTIHRAGEREAERRRAVGLA